MLIKEALTKKDYLDEIANITDTFMENISLNDFKSLTQFGLEAKNVSDLESSVYFFDNGKFKLTKTSDSTIRDYIAAVLTEQTLKDMIEISHTEEEYLEQTKLVLDSVFYRAKNTLESNMKHSLITNYHKTINYVVDNAKEKGLLDNSNPYKNDSARIRKALFFDEAMNPDFDFSKVSIRINDTESILRGFLNYVNKQVPEILKTKQTEKTPEARVIDEINNYYNNTSNLTKTRIAKILSRNNNEVYVKVDTSPLALKNTEGILKYISPVDTKYTFYQTTFGLWSVVDSDETEPKVTTLYTITSKPIRDCVQISKTLATRFHLGIMPVWVANKMYLKKIN